MIRLHNVQITAGTFELAEISFEVRAGEYAVLMGRTGSGKTTILEAIGGLRPIRHGSIQIADRDVTRLSPAGRSIGYVPQDLALFDTMSVRDNLSFALKIRGRDSRAISKRVDRLASLLHLEDLLDRSVTRLSGGEAQRVALGRALSFEPAVVLLDEPLSALDEPTRIETYKVLRRVRSETDVTILHVTHSTAEAEALATQRLLLDAGRVNRPELNQRPEDPSASSPTGSSSAESSSRVSR